MIHDGRSSRSPVASPPPIFSSPIRPREATHPWTDLHPSPTPPPSSPEAGSIPWPTRRSPEPNSSPRSPPARGSAWLQQPPSLRLRPPPRRASGSTPTTTGAPSSAGPIASNRARLSLSSVFHGRLVLSVALILALPWLHLRLGSAVISHRTRHNPRSSPWQICHCAPDQAKNSPGHSDHNRNCQPSSPFMLLPWTHMTTTILLCHHLEPNICFPLIAVTPCLRLIIPRARSSFPVRCHEPRSLVSF